MRCELIKCRSATRTASNQSKTNSRNQVGIVKFESFSAQAFECLAQALCVRILGPGTIVFGSGPDGAREATFDGEVPFPSSADRWNGYIVVQAKCREKLKNNQEDATWLCTQL